MKVRGFFGTMLLAWQAALAEPAFADRLRIDVAAEIDSNMHRVDDVAEPEPGGFLRYAAGGALAHAWGTVTAWGSLDAQLRQGLDAATKTEGTVLGAADAGVGGPLATRTRWALHGAALGYAGTEASGGVRDVGSYAGDAAILLDDEAGQRAWARVGHLAFATGDTSDADFTALQYELGWALTRTNDANISRWDVTASYERSLRVFGGAGAVDGCVTAQEACSITTLERRSDDVHTLEVGVQHTARALWSLGYRVAWQRSTLEQVSSWRHSINLGCTARIRGKLYGTTRVKLEFDRYPDGLTLYGNPTDVTAGVLLENDQRNEAMVLLSYRATKAVFVEAAAFLWRDGFGGGDRQYQRMLGTLGVGVMFGRGQ